MANKESRCRNCPTINKDDKRCPTSNKLSHIDTSIVISPNYLRFDILLITIILPLSAIFPLSAASGGSKEHILTAVKRSPTTSIADTHSASVIFPEEKLLSEEVKSLIEQGYHNSTDSLNTAIKNLAQKHSNIAGPFTIGLSVHNNSILGLKISSDKLTENNESTKPGVVLLGGIHGDHALGHEMTLHMAAFLLDGYESDTKIKHLIDSLDLYFIPTLNPDGFYLAKEGDCDSARQNSGRTNAAGVDLDTDFRFHNYNDISSVLANNNLQPETKALLDWIVTEGRKVQMFVTLRTGLTGITYPYDELPEQITEHTYISSGSSLTPNPAPDKKFFEHLGHQVYYKYQSEPLDSKCNPIANNVTVLDGAQIGSTYGTLSDFLYKFTNIFPINVYLDCCKYPKSEQLSSKWLQHSNSLFALLESSHLGISGFVIDVNTKKPIPRARIVVPGNNRNVTSYESGQYWRPMEPGRMFDVHVEAAGYKSTSALQVLGSDLDPETGLVMPKILNFTLEPLINEHPSTVKSQEDAKLNGIPKEISSPDAVKSTMPSEDPSTTVVLKPKALFEDVDKHIAGLDFKTPTELRKHHNYTEMVEILKSLNERFPKISRLYDIGASRNGKKLWVLEISDKPGVHQLLKPEFRYIGNVHGNEVVGRELLLYLAKLLLENYGSDSLITAMVDSTRIHLLPSMNPDGYEKSFAGDCESEIGRGNARQVDLNRNFPDRFGVTSENESTEPEVEAIMKWSHENPFVLGANLHGGSLVANYPFDGNEARENVYEASPDDKLFRHLAKTYSMNHPTMGKGEHCYDICGKDRTNLLNERFPGGITNGAAWYVLYGGIQDWIYLHTSCLSLTFELGCMKYPRANDMPQYWSYNKKSLIKYMLEIHRGIYGIVTDQYGQPVPNATVHIKGIDHDIYSSETGDYWRILLPGEYFVSVSKEKYRTANRKVIVGIYGSPAVRHDFALRSGSKDLPASANEYNETGSSSLDDTITIGKEGAHENANDKSHTEASSGVPIDHTNRTKPPSIFGNFSLAIEGSKLVPRSQDTRYMLALCFIIVMPSIALLIYMFGLTDSKRKPYKFGFSRLSTNNNDEFDGDDDDEGTRFMKRPARGPKFTSLEDGPASDSEDELYNAGSWNK